MARATLQPPYTPVFHGFLLWFLAKIAALLIVSAWLLQLAVRSGQLWPLAVVALAATGAVVLATQYNTEAVIVHEANVICRHGALGVHETTVPLWPLTLKINQSLLGRILDYGTVQLYFDATMVELRNVAH